MLQNFILIEEKVSKFKALCFQFSWFKPSFLHNFFEFRFLVFSEQFNILTYFWLFGDLFHFDLRWEKKRDHAGIGLNITLLGLFLSIHFYDTRHWNNHTDKWEE